MNDQNTIVEVSPESFQSEVLERSRQLPVVLLFWAAQVPEAAQAKHSLETLAKQYQGKFVLGLVDVQRDQTLAQHLRVQGLPSVRVVHREQITDQLDGAQSEQALKQFLDRLTMSSGELLRSKVGELIATGDLAAAEQAVRQALNDEPGNDIIKVQLAELVTLQGRLEEGSQMLSGIAPEVEGVKRVAGRIELMQEAEQLPDTKSLEEALANNPDDLALKYQLSIAAAAAGSFELAMQQAMDILLADRSFENDLGRLTLLRLFELQEKGSPLVARFRRKMFAFLH